MENNKAATQVSELESQFHSLDIYSGMTKRRIMVPKHLTINPLAILDNRLAKLRNKAKKALANAKQLYPNRITIIADFGQGGLTIRHIDDLRLDKTEAYTFKITLRRITKDFPDAFIEEHEKKEKNA